MRESVQSFFAPGRIATMQRRRSSRPSVLSPLRPFLTWLETLEKQTGAATVAVRHWLRHTWVPQPGRDARGELPPRNAPLFSALHGWSRFLRHLRLLLTGRTRDNQRRRPWLKVEQLEPRWVFTITEFNLGTNFGNDYAEFHFVEGNDTVQVLGAFSVDPGPAGDYTVSVNWGDGTTSDAAVSVIPTSNGLSATFLAGHAYADETWAPLTMTATLSGDGDSATLTALIFVDGATLSVTVGPIGPLTEGAPYNSNPVATFTDPNPLATLYDFTASIDWGDGTGTSTGIVSGGNGFFTVSAAYPHTYLEEGVYPFTVAITGAGQTVQQTINVTVDDAPLHITPADPFTAVEGQDSGTHVLARFTDEDPNGQIGDYTATIIWDDGTQETGSIVLENVYTVIGSHTWDEEGDKYVTIIVTDHPSTASTTIDIRVADAPIHVTAQSVPDGVEQTSSGLQTLAIFTDDDPNGEIGDYSATVIWELGQSPEIASIVENGPHQWAVQGSHFWEEEGVYSVHVDVQDQGGSTDSVDVPVWVYDAPLSILPAGGTLGGVEGQPLSNVLLATFSDPADEGDVTEYTATINWGDGTSSAGQIAPQAGGYTVTGSHTYSGDGSYTATVQVQDIGGSVALTAKDVTIAEANLTVQASAIIALGGVPTGSVVVGTLTDANPLALASDFTATVEWGDGTASPGTVQANDDGTFAVRGSHTYAATGSYALLVSVQEVDGGASASDFAAVTVVTAPLTLHVLNPAPITEGTNSGSLQLATYQYGGDPAALHGTVSFFGVNYPVQFQNGFVTVPVPANVFTEEGAYTFSLSISANSETATGIGSLLVVGAPINATAVPVSATEGTPFSGVVARFTELGSTSTAADFSATIVWGDGHSSLGAVTANNQGGYDVTGNNLYTEEGSFPVTVQLAERDSGSKVTVQTTATVTEAHPIVEVVPDTSMTVGESFSGLVGSFSGVGYDPKSDFTVQVDWGDGAGPQAATFLGPEEYRPWLYGPYWWGYSWPGGPQAPNPLPAWVNNPYYISFGPDNQGYGYYLGQFVVPGGHTFATTGTFTLTLTVVDKDGFTASDSVNITVFPLPPGGTPPPGTPPPTDPYLTVSVPSDVQVGEGALAVIRATATHTPQQPPPPPPPWAPYQDLHRLYSVDVDWGDGTSSLWTRAFPYYSPAIDVTTSDWINFSIVGKHIYVTDGSYTVKMTVEYDMDSFPTETGTWAAYGPVTAFSHVTVSEVPITDVTLTGRSAPLHTNEGVPLTNASLAVFTFGDPAAGVGEFTADVNWGDGTHDPGIIQGANGNFTVSGSHTYPRVGVFPLTVNLSHWKQDGNGVTVSKSFTTIATSVSVLDWPLSAFGAPPLTATTGQLLAGALLATFTDADPNAVAGNYRALIAWGDGTTGTGTIGALSGSNTWTVTASHPYAVPGAYTARVVIQDLTGYRSTAAATAIDVIPAQPPAGTTTATGLRLEGNEGTLLGGVVATFTDLNPAHGGCCFDGTINWGSADIDWGDGSHSPGGLVPMAGPGHTYQILGQHTYAHAGAFPVRVTIRATNGTVLATAASTAVADEQDLRVTAASFTTGVSDPWNNDDGSTGLHNAVVATFTDDNPLATTASFWPVTISWGDGSADPGTVLLSNGTFYVVGSHRYTTPGVFTTRVMLSDDGTAAVAEGTVTVLPATAGRLTDVPTPDVHNANPFEWMLDTVVALGDGTPRIRTYYGYDSPGPWADPGFFGPWVPTWAWGNYSTWWDCAATSPYLGLDTSLLLLGPTFHGHTNHVYARPGRYAIAGTSRYSSDEVVESHRRIAVANGSLSVFATLPLVAAQEGQAMSGVTLVTFADEDPLATGFSARIAWGDGTESDGQIAPNADGTFGVTGGHTYLRRGTYPIVVVISHAGTASVAATTNAVVRADPPPLQGRNIGALAGYSTGSIPVATLNAPLAQPGDFSASINWGDGVSAGTVSQAADGTFRVYGNHTYAAAGSYHVRVTLTAASAGSSTSDATATVLAWSLSAQERTEEPEQSQPLAINQAAAELNTGGLLLTYPLDFDQSPGTSVGGNPALVYNSNTVAVRPIVEVNLGSSSGDPVPSKIQVQLVGDNASLHTFATTGHVAGDAYLLGAELSAPATFTGQVTRTAHVHIQFAGGLAVDTEVSARGPEVVRDILTGPQADPFGAGWGIAGVDRLFFNCDGVSWVTGSGDSRFFKDNGNGTYTSPPEDFGNLVQLPDFSFVYSAKDLTHLLFDKNGLLRRVVDRDSLALVYDYDTDGRLKTVTAPDGSTTTLLYSPANGLLSMILEPGNRTLIVTHNAGNLSVLSAYSVTEGPQGPSLFTDIRTRTFGYDGKHHLTRDQWAPLDTGFHYAADTGRLDQVDRGLGTTLSIDAAGVQALHNPALHPGDALAKVTDARNNATRYQLDALGRLLLQRSADDTVQTWQCNSHGQVIAYTDGRQHTTEYQFDTVGDLRQIDYPDSSYVLYDYHPLFHTVTRYQDGRGNVTLFGYNATGDLVRTEDALHEVTTQLWINGLLQSITDPALHTTRFEYDGQRRLIDTVDALQNHTTLAYDTDGNVLTTEDALHRITTTVYDGRNLLVRRTDAAGGLWDWDYTSAGLLRQETDARHIATTYAYDIRGLLTGTSEGIDTNPQPGPDVSRRSTREYDAAGNLQELITGIASHDEHRTRTRYEYDALNRVTDVIRIDWYSGERLTMQTAYDDAGNVASVTAPNQVVTSYAYDARNRLTDTYENWQPGSAVSPPTYDRLTHRFYDQAGNLSELTTGLGGDHPWPSTTHYEYDALNRVREMTEAQGTPEQRTTTYAYDAVGNLAGMTSGLAGGPGAAADYAKPLVSRYEYDDVNRRVRVEEGWHDDPNDDEGGGFADRVTTMTYDKVGNLLSVRSGLSDTAPSHASLTSYAYDALNQRTQIYEGWAPSLIPGLPTFDRLTINSYDAVGNLVGVGTGLSTNFQSHVSLTSYAYDALGRRTDEWDGWMSADEVHSTFVYDSSDNLIDATTGLAERNADPQYAHRSETRYDYDGFNRRTGMTQAVNSDIRPVRTSMAYDAVGNLLSTTRFSSDANDPRQVVTSYGYDALNRRTTTIEAWHALETGWAPPSGTPLPYWLVGIQRTTTAVYDSADQLIEETMGQTQDPSTNLPVVNRYGYDHLGRLTSQTLAANWRDETTTTMAYDAAGNLIWQTTGLGSENAHPATTHYEYDTLGQKIKITEAWHDPLAERSTEFRYDGAANLIERIDPLLRHTRYTYDSLNRQNGVYENDRFVDGVEKYDRLTTMVYDAPGNLINQTTGQSPDQSANNPATTHFVYDYLNRRTDVYEAWGDSSLQRHSTVIYDAAGNVRRQVKGMAEGNGAYAHPVRSDYTHDALNRLTLRVDDLSFNGQTPSRTTQTFYDGFGNVRAVEAPDPRGSGTQQVQFQYDPLGRLVDRQDPPGAALTANQTWDLGGLSIHTTYTYNAADNAVRVTDANGQGTAYQYDRFHHVVQRTDPEGGRTNFVYDRAGNRLEMTDADRNTTTFAYDKLNQLISVKDPLGHMSFFYYDDASRLERTIDRLGRQRVLHYDGLDHLQREEWFDLTGTTLVETLDFTFDAADNLRSAGNSQLAYTFAVNALHQVTDSSTLPGEPPGWPVLGLRLHFTYDAAGNRITAEEKDPFGQSMVMVASQYDAANRLRQRRFQGQGKDLAVSLDYNKQDELIGVVRRSLNAGDPVPNISTAYSYDHAGRLLNLGHRLDSVQPDGSTNLLRPFSLATYVYDAGGRLSQEAYGVPPANGGSGAWSVTNQSYHYDQTDQLTNDGQGYHYDPNGNPTDGTALDTGNRITSDGSWDYAYDAEGNLRQRTSHQLVTVADGTLQQLVPAEVWSYRYDYANRLVEARRDRPGNGPAGTLQANRRSVTVFRYGYDALGNRVWRRQEMWRETKGDGPDGEWTVDAGSQQPVAGTSYAYDGGQVWLEKDTQNSDQRRYLRGDIIGQVFGHVWKDINNNIVVSWYLADRQGSVRMVLSEQAGVIADIRYTSFGAPQVPNLFFAPPYLPGYAYAGRTYESGPGLQYDRGRYYDPVRMRWLSQVPFGLGGGDANPYRYAGNSPTNSTDHTGDSGAALPWLHSEVLGHGDERLPVTWLDVSQTPEAASLTPFDQALLQGVANVTSFGLGVAGAHGEELRGLGGAAEMVFGAASLLAPTGVSQAAGIVLLAHGLDTLVAAGRSGRSHVETFTFQGTYAAAVWAGADEEAARSTAGWVDFGVPLAAGLVEMGVHLVRVAGLLAREAAASGELVAQESAQVARLAEADLAEGVSAGPRRLSLPVIEEPGMEVYRGACFAAGTPLRTPEGSKLIELFHAGDLVLSRDENDPVGPVVAKRVEEVFVRTARVWHLQVAGRVVQTTGEHPFWAWGRGWVPAWELSAEDRIMSECGQWLVIEEVKETGEYATVYNLRVADFHTYFVGCAEWGFSAWAHNEYRGIQANDMIEAEIGRRLSKNTQAAAVARAVETGNEPLVRNLLVGYGVPPRDVDRVVSRLFADAGVTPQATPVRFAKSGLTPADLQPPPGAPVGATYKVNAREPITLDLTNPNWKQSIPSGTPVEGIYIVRTQQGQILKPGDLSGLSRLGEYRGWVINDGIPIVVDYYPLEQPLPGSLRRVAQDLRAALQADGWNLPRDWENIAPNTQRYVNITR
jgi:RHS repeat-associated protein